MKKLAVLGLMLFLVSGCFGNDEVEDVNGNDEENDVQISCYDYVINQMDDLGWMKTGDGMMFTNKENNYWVWNISSNVFTDMEEQVYLYIINDEIFVDGDFDNNLYEELKDEREFAKYKSLVDEIHADFDAKGCPLRGKDPSDLNEDYKEIYIEN